MRNYLFILLMCLVVFSCSEPSVQSSKKGTEDELKIKFGHALAKALADSPSLRKTLKDEGLKMFDNDYDVLYHLIKNNQLSDGTTVRQFLLNYFNDEAELSEIETSLPLLTIFIPKLPEESFSVEAWDTENQIPVVGIETATEILQVDSKGDKSVVTVIPDYPIVLIKQNERVVKRFDSNRSQASGRAFRTSDNLEFEFISDAFDGALTSKGLTNARATTTPDPKVLEAYNLYNGTEGWHRDYIYYNISPTQPDGAFVYDYMEYITEFGLSATDGTYSVYQKISEQTADPKLKSKTSSPSGGWTEGFYEFKVQIVRNAKNGLGSTKILYFPASADQLFGITYDKVSGGYKPRVSSVKSMYPNLPILNWDLSSYATTIGIDIEEVDATETIVTTETKIVKYAANFSIEGFIKKIGLKFGASAEQTENTTVQKTTTLGSDPLGEVEVNFADNIITSVRVKPGVETGYFTREYSTGWYGISVEPVRVQE